MLRWRLSLGVLIVAALAAIGWADLNCPIPGLPLFILALVVATLGAAEAAQLVPVGNAKPHTATVCYGVLIVLGAAGVPCFWQGYPADCPIGRLGWPWLGFAGALLLIICDEFRRYRGPGDVGERIARSTFSVAYLGLLSFAIQLRALGEEPLGFWAVISMILVVKMSDIGAYTVGKLVGKHKLAPTLSPGKTWEGVLGGVVFACGSSFLFFTWLLPKLVSDHPPMEASDAGWAIYGILMAVVGLIGDLAESLLKRDAVRKDSSQWMPGFGGVLDLLDSLLAAAPVAYLCWAANLVR